MEFRRVIATPDRYEAYIALFAACFPSATHYSMEYLAWLYAANPAGQVVGFDALDGEELAAHYVCVPANVTVRGKETRAILSLNTATHPRHQGKGLFTRLAEQTYALAEELGFECAYGVANANSTPGFVRKLGFQLVAPLQASLGFGSLGIVNWASVKSNSEFIRSWDSASIAWRVANPNRRVRLGRGVEDGVCCWAATGRPGIVAWAEIPITFDVESYENCGLLRPFGARLFLGTLPIGSARFSTFMSIPKRFRPSPLNLIYRSLGGQSIPLEAGRVTTTFLDFDAY